MRDESVNGESLALVCCVNFFSVFFLTSSHSTSIPTVTLFFSSNHCWQPHKPVMECQAQFEDIALGEASLRNTSDICFLLRQELAVSVVLVRTFSRRGEERRRKIREGGMDWGDEWHTPINQGLRGSAHSEVWMPSFLFCFGNVPLIFVCATPYSCLATDGGAYI